jgi:SH3-like domain-containing protein
VKLFRSTHFRRFGLAFALAAMLTLGACKGRGRRVLEVAYVSAPQASLRDQVATIYNRVGTVKNGERVEVMEHEKRFSRVRTASGLEGWIEQRYLVDQDTFDQIQKLTQENQNDLVQAPGVMRNDTNLHVTPGRETEHLYLLTAGAKVSILKRSTADKDAPAPKPVVSKPVTAKPAGTKPVGNKAVEAKPVAPQPEPATPMPANPVAPKAAAKAAPVLEDWWLVRDSLGRIGWVLARMVDVDAPLDIAQYAEGQRFVGVFVLSEVDDEENGVKKKVPQYLCALTEPHDGQPYDYDQIRVFTWNARKHRYETAYREHGLDGVLPIQLTKENFDKEGDLPVFVLRVKDDSGAVSERKYKMNSPMVRRVLAPGEQKQAPTPRTSARSSARATGKKRRRH